jgi:taurine transport system substrate-binding protein
MHTSRANDVARQLIDNGIAIALAGLVDAVTIRSKRPSGRQVIEMRKLSRRYALGILGGAVACSTIGRAKAAADTINLSYQTGDINVLLMYVVGTGLFEKHGLDVKLQPFPAGPQQLPALASGETDIAWLGEFPAVTSYANGLQLQIFMIERTDTSHQRLVANPASGIKSLADLKGKTLGVSIGSTSHFLATLALSKVGLTLNDVQLVNLTPENMPPAYLSNRIDAAFTWEPNISLMEKAGGITLASPATLGQYTAGVFVGRKAFLESKADTVQRFLAAWDEGLQVYLKVPRDVMPFEAKRLGMSVDEVEALVRRQNSHRTAFKEVISSKYLGAVGQTGSSDYAHHLAQIADFLFEQKKISSTSIDWSGLLNAEPITTYLKGRA